MKLVLLLAAALAVRLSAGEIKSPPWDQSHLSIGRDLYRENCSVCHDIEKTQKQTRKIGPSLNHLFKNEKLPMSHGKPSRPYVVCELNLAGV